MPQLPPAEVLLDTALAAALIAEQFPHLAPLHVEPFGEGWDNIAFLVNQTYVFRFPRRQFSVPLMESEIRLLPAIAPRLPLPIPSPQFIGQPGPRYPWPFAGYRQLPGHTLCRARLDDHQRIAMARPLAHFLKTLHTIPTGDALRAGATGDTIGRANIALRQPKAIALLEKAVQAHLVENPATLRTIIESAPASRPLRRDTLAHGDLYCRHLLVNAGQLCGIIDWGDAHLGDPAVDLAIAWSLFTPAGRALFLGTYGPVDPQTLAAARFRATQHALVIALYAHEIADPGLLREQRLSLRNIEMV